MLGLSMDELATRCGVAKRTLIRFENGQAEPHGRTLTAIRTALEAAGVVFTDGEEPGVKLRKQEA